jgi:hypothetical protein
MKDFLGQELSVGDRVVYGASLGKCAAVGVGIVLELKEPPPREPFVYREPMQVYIRPEKTQSSYLSLKPRWFKFAERMVKIPCSSGKS